MRSDKFATLNEIDSIIEPFDDGKQVYNDGTYIKCPINERYVELNDLKESISLRFGAYSTFNIFINNEKIDLFDFKISKIVKKFTLIMMKKMLFKSI